MSKPTEPSHRACVQITRNYVCDAMSDGEYYRRQAKEAQAHADRAIRDEDRVAWLRLAQSWLALLPFRRATPQEAFDEAVLDQGTHQDISKDSQ